MEKHILPTAANSTTWHQHTLRTQRRDGRIRISSHSMGTRLLHQGLAELPAPLPPAPPTTTSEQQLQEDELLARKLHQLDIDDARERSSSNVSQYERPSSMMVTSSRGRLSLPHHHSSQSLRPRSLSLTSANMPYSPGSFGPPPAVSPEMIAGPAPVPEYPQSPSHNLPIPIPQAENLPIPVLADQYPTLSPSVLPNSAPLSAYLEQHRQVPYPPQWKTTEALATFYAYQGGRIAPGSSWLDAPETFIWRTIRPEEHAHNPAPPSYTFKFKMTSSIFSSPKYGWVMSYPEATAATSKKPLKSQQSNSWAYDLKLDSHTQLRKSEVLTNSRLKSVLTTYVHAQNYDSLRFIGPDGRAYMWVSSTTVSSLDGARYDTLRHALFAASGNIPDPLYGEIVADHTFWDGYIDEAEVHVGIRCQGCQAKPIVGLRWKCRTCPHHDVCNACRILALSGRYAASISPTCDFSLVNLPDEALYIRSPMVDTALVVATLQVLKDWEKHSMRGEKRRHGKSFLASENAARTSRSWIDELLESGGLDQTESR